MFELEVFRKQTICIAESICDIAWTFRCLPAVIWRPHSNLSPWELCPLPPRYAFGCNMIFDNG